MASAASISAKVRGRSKPSTGTPSKRPIWVAENSPAQRAHPGIGGPKAGGFLPSIHEISDTFGKPVGQSAFDLQGCDNRLRLVTFRAVNRDGGSKNSAVTADLRP